MAFGWGRVNQIGNQFFTQINENNSWNNQWNNTFSNNNNNNKGKILNLLNFNLECIPRIFTITTNNGSYKFNIDFLKETSSVIKKAIENDPNNLQFHINVDDDQNVMKKVEDLYQNKKVIFYISDLIVLHQIIGALNIVDCPSFMLPEKLQPQNSVVPTKATVQIDIKYMQDIFFQTFPKTFIIVANDKEYECNSLGVNSSKIIRQFREENPEENRFILTYEEDDKNGLELIKNFFNFEKVEITINNMNSLQKVAEILQIELILSDIENYIDSYENATQLIDDKKVLISTIDQIFEWLFNIEKLTVSTVTKNIINSVWIQSESDVKELTSCIVHVSHLNFARQPFLIDLIVELDEQAKDEKNVHLKILIPFIKKWLLNDNLCNSPHGSFVYKLYRRGIIELDEILEKVPHLSFSNFFMWFYPEFYEQKMKLPEINKQSIGSKFISKYTIDEYKKVRDSNEPDDSIANAIFHDDVDKLQQLISSRKIDINDDQIAFNLHDEIRVDPYLIGNSAGKTFINYASECGSIKCFKYLFLNHANLDDFSLSFAVFGGNSEIIRTVDQNQQQIINFHERNYNFLIGKLMLSNPLVPAILLHRHDLFDWIIEDKNFLSVIEMIPTNSFSNRNAELSSILNCMSSSSNAHALTSLIDKGMNIDSLIYDNQYFHNLIPLSVTNGFFRFTQLLLSFKSAETSPPLNLKQSLFYSCVCSGNLSIVKYLSKEFIDISDKEVSKLVINFDSSFLVAIQYEYLDIIEYLFEILEQKKWDINIKSIFLTSILNSSKKSTTFDYLADKLNLQNLLSTNKITLTDLIQFVGNACVKNKFEIVKKLTDIIILNEPKTDFTSSFIDAVNSGSDEICKYFIDKKVFLNVPKIVKRSNVVNVNDGKIALYLIDISKPEMKKTFSQCFLNDAILKGNKNLVEILLKSCQPDHNSLIEAVRSHNLEIVKIILGINKKISFLNELSINGTVLNIAVINEDVEIVKFLLSIPGIDPNLYDIDNCTPLINAITKMNIDIINALLDFFGDDIQKQMWQIDEGLKKMLQMLSNFTILKGENKRTRKLRQKNFIIESKEKVSSIVNRLIKIDNIDLNCHSNKYTLLSYACQVNEIDLVKLLLSLDNIDVNSYGPINGNTPLMVAIENKNVEIACLLIEFPKTNINVKNYFMKTALIMAVDHNLEQVISCLINSSKFDPDESCLNHAFFDSSDKIAQQLAAIESLDVNYSYKYENNKKIDDFYNSRFKKREQQRMLQQQQETKSTKKVKSYDLFIYETTLIHAVKNKRNDVVDLIINHPSFDPNESQLISAIFVAVDTEQNEMAEKLLKLNDNDVNINNLNNQSLLSFSVIKRNKDFVTKILENDSFDSIKSNLFEAFVKSIHPTLNPEINNLKVGFMAPNFNNNLGFGLPQNNNNNNNNNNKVEASIDIMNDLLEYDENHNHILNFDNLLPNGKSFFTIISPDINNIVDVVEYFLDHNVDPNKPDKYGIYPLELAIRMNSQLFVSSLLNSNRIDLSIRINNDAIKNETFLHLAARNDTFQDILDKNQIDINALDDLGETPLMKACLFLKQKNVLELFRKDELDYKHRNNDGDDCLDLVKNNSNNGFGFGMMPNTQYRNLLRGGQFPEEKIEYFVQLAPYLRS